MAANLAKARERGEHMNLALADSFFGDRFHDLLAAATQFSQIKFPLVIAQLAIAALFDAVGQVFRNVLFQPAQEQRTQSGGEPSSSNALSGFGVFAARLVGFSEMVLITKIA